VTTAPSQPSAHARSRADACSVQWDTAQAPAFGTASVAGFWVALEQSGPWGREAATQSHLDPEVGQALDQLCQSHGGRFILIRRPGGHADTHGGDVRRVYVAGGAGSRPWLLEADLDLPERLGQLPWEALAAGDLELVQDGLPELEEATGPVLLVCTNSRRDVCCAVRGRPVALAVAAARPGQVWECSHTGGHRFAPTAVLLPHGQTYARLDEALATEALDAGASDEVPLRLLGARHDRGRSLLSPPAQAAESTVRHRIGEGDLTALSTTADPLADGSTGWRCTVRHRDGRSWTLAVLRRDGDGGRPESCGKAPVPTWTWQVDPVQDAPFGDAQS